VAAAQLNLFPPGAPAPTDFLVEQSAGVGGEPTAMTFNEGEVIRAIAGAGAEQFDRGYRVSLSVWADHGRRRRRRWS
jgi:hypothetical protein